MHKLSIYQFLLFQSAVLSCVAVVTLFFLGFVAFYSVILGATLVLIPQTYFALRVFRFKGAKFIPLIIRNFYIAETVKFLITFAGFSLVFSLVHPLNDVAFILAFIFGQLLFWTAPIFFGSQSSKIAVANSSVYQKTTRKNNALDSNNHLLKDSSRMDCYGK